MKLEIKGHESIYRREGKFHFHFKTHIATVGDKNSDDEINVSVAGESIIISTDEFTRAVKLMDLVLYMLNSKVKDSKDTCCVCGKKWKEDQDDD